MVGGTPEVVRAEGDLDRVQGWWVWSQVDQRAFGLGPQEAELPEESHDGSHPAPVSCVVMSDVSVGGSESSLAMSQTYILVKVCLKEKAVCGKSSSY